MSFDPYSPPRAEPLKINADRASGSTWMWMALFSGIFYGLFMALFFGLKGPNHRSGILIGLASGLIFGPVMGLVTRHQCRKAQANPPDTGGENPVFEGIATCISNPKKSRTGYLILTRQRILFRDNEAKPGEPDWSANLQDISAVRISKYLGMIPNRLRLDFSDGKTEPFIINDHRRWLAAFSQARNAAASGEPQS